MAGKKWVIKAPPGEKYFSPKWWTTRSMAICGLLAHKGMEPSFGPLTPIQKQAWAKLKAEGWRAVSSTPTSEEAAGFQKVRWERRVPPPRFGPPNEMDWFVDPDGAAPADLGAGAPEIEISEEMIAAGAEVICRCFSDVLPYGSSAALDVADQVYRAMAIRSADDSATPSSLPQEPITPTLDGQSGLQQKRE